MVVEASVTGLFRTVLIIIGVLVVLRTIGRALIAKRNLDEEKKLKQRERDFQKRKEFIQKNQGKTSVIGKSKITAEDTSFEEVK